MQVETQFIFPDIIPLFQKIAADEQDSVRLQAVEVCVALGKKLTPEQTLEHVVPVIRATSSDKAWRVRYMAAFRFTAVRSFSLSLSLSRSLSLSLSLSLVSRSRLGLFVRD